jgi:hypothetical protein
VELAFEGGGVDGGAERAEVVVLAGSTESERMPKGVSVRSRIWSPRESVAMAT